jgi:hypothetical protein
VATMVTQSLIAAVRQGANHLDETMLLNSSKNEMAMS